MIAISEMCLPWETFGDIVLIGLCVMVGQVIWEGIKYLYGRSKGHVRKDRTRR